MGDWFRKKSVGKNVHESPNTLGTVAEEISLSIWYNKIVVFNSTKGGIKSIGLGGNPWRERVLTRAKRLRNQ